MPDAGERCRAAPGGAIAALGRGLRNAQGAALLTVLLLMMLMLTLVSAMLAAASREIMIAGLHRDAIRAEEHAQAGLEDLLGRMAAGRPWKPATVDPSDRCLQRDGIAGIATALPGADLCTSVLTRLPGADGAFVEVRSDARLGRVSRRLSAVVLARTATALTGVVILHNLTENADVRVNSGEVHVRTYARYQSEAGALRPTYAGWRIGQAAASGAEIGPCYTHAECVEAGRPQWWPGHRRAVYGSLPLRPLSTPGDPTPDLRVPSEVLGYSCPEGPSPGRRLQTIGSDGPGFQETDLRADLTPTSPLQADLAFEPLYGCTPDGLPYTWMREAVATDDDPDADPQRALWFAVVRFEEWRERYECFDERALSWAPCHGFHTDPSQGDPSLGAVLPLLPQAAWAQNYDVRRAGGGALTPADLDLGRCTDPPLCRNPANTRVTVALEHGDYSLVCPSTCPEGHGVFLVGGSLLLTGGFTYRGVMVVDGTLQLGPGEASIYGTLSAVRIATLGGTLRLFAGTSVAIGSVGPAAISRRSWWER